MWLENIHYKCPDCGELTFYKDGSGTISCRACWKLPNEKDSVNNPEHYTSHPSSIECIQITEHMGFNLGNALKYIWRCDLKKDAIEDLKKARWYLNREIDKRTK